MNLLYLFEIFALLQIKGGETRDIPIHGRLQNTSKQMYQKYMYANYECRNKCSLFLLCRSVLGIEDLSNVAVSVHLTFDSF